jgi:5-methyltetrahydropteroyltriglutamate--homocysteine methyltransferase
MTIATNLGFPRIGKQRELKRALEAFWSGKSDANALQATATSLRAEHWRLQRSLGIEHVPSNDFALYDQVLDTVQWVGAVPPRYRELELDPLHTYFAMARGRQSSGADVRAMEMTKWFDTNYHFIVPELEEGTTFRLAGDKPLAELRQAAALGIATRPVLLGPVSFLLLGKMDGRQARAALDRLLPVYEELLSALGREGATWVQIDEPCLVTDLSEEIHGAYRVVFERLARAPRAPKILLATYFGALGSNLDLAVSLPTAGLHVDLVRAPDQLRAVSAALPKDRVLSAGVVDGRNVWRADLDDAYAKLRTLADARGAENLFVAPSCSLLHCPVDRQGETFDPELSSWLAFATDKLEEVAALARAVDRGDTVSPAFEKSRACQTSRRASRRVHDPKVTTRMASITASMARRASPYATRRERQKALGLPPLPTTTIGSFPQTAAVRAARAEHKAGKRDQAAYDAFLRSETERAVRRQEALGIDVLVHGEFERNDMVEYFGEQLAGFAFTANGWVQSYGSRCVKPPVIYGDVSRPAPMTVEWSRYAQSLTNRPMKGMLTGPVTILQWSFVRDDQPRSVTCRQIALAIRDEVHDLEAAGLRIIQIDEPAIREGLPLRRADWNAYLAWAVEAFGLASSPVRDDTQIHTHMCYSEFNDVIESIAAMDADVVSIETSRSRMDLLDAFATFRYPNEVGPGVYDIHSPRVPTVDEIVDLLLRAARVLPADQLWVNPDCGLKTRGWEEVEPALAHMVEAAQRVRTALASGARLATVHRT